MYKNEWWKKSIIYQIYPKSFQDSNADGMGDLQGIIHRLPYLKQLGVDVIWLSPCYKSPMDDGGYDISDFYAIDPMFGTMADMDELIEKAKNYGIKILMDLVINHTSDEHAWFEEALRDPHSKYRDFYIFRKGINGQPPNNWRSYFGGSAWEKVPNEEDIYYLHAFSKKQPDLNWENDEMRENIIKMINWWLAKGLGGFRIDAILNLKKPENFYEIYPVDGNDGYSFIGNQILNRTGILDWLQEIDKRCFRKYNAFTVSEADVSDEELEDYVGDNGVFRTTFDFSYADIDTPPTGEWYLQHEWTVPELRENIFNHQLKAQKIGWGVEYLENHDQPRSINKYIPEEHRNEISKKMLATLYMMLHGTPFIYQGQEIGMENIRMSSMDDYDDIATHEIYKRALLAGISKKEAFESMFNRSRDNSRTPMQWNSKKNAGFSEAENTWLLTNSNYKKINVTEQEKKENSVLNFYKKLINLRKESNKYSEVVVFGQFVPIDYMEENLIAYKRILGNKEIFVLVNFSSEDLTIELDEKFNTIILDNYVRTKINHGKLSLKAYQSIVLANYI